MTKNLTLELEARGPITPADYVQAREHYAAYRIARGYKGDAPFLTPPESQAKLGKGDIPLFSWTGAPASTSGSWNACTWSTEQCRAACVLTARYPSVHKARTVRTEYLAEFPEYALALIIGELKAAVAIRGPIGFRPNAATDLRWERFAPSIFAVPDVTVYDYTKAPASQRTAQDNYRIVFSVSEVARSTREAIDHLEAGGNAAVVFDTGKGKALPATWQGFDVVDGDVTDARFTDPAGTVVGLRAKGKARGRTGAEDTFVKAGVAS